MSKPNTERADWDVTDIPELLAEIESLRASNGQIRGDLARSAFSEREVWLAEGIDTWRKASDALWDKLDSARAEVDRLKAEVARAANERLNARDSGELTVCRNLGCMVVFHAADKCPACNDEAWRP